MDISTKIINPETDKTYTGYLATIDETMLGYEDHGFLTASISLSFNGSGVSFGFHVLGTASQSWPYEEGNTPYLRLWIDKILGVTDSDRWEGVKGKKLYVLFEGEGYVGSRASGICSISGKAWFIPEEFSLIKPETEEVVEYS